MRPELSKGRLAIVLIGCFATLLLALLDQTIVGAVSWTMVRRLDPAHGVQLLPWLLTGYALADTVVLPLYGKLADVYGAKRVYLCALGIFMTGSALCGMAQNMAELIAFRALQGLGAGGLMSLTMVIMGMLVRGEDGRQRGGGTAGFGGVLVGVGMALGPSVGGLLADNLNWRWVFYINLPLGIAAFLIILTLLRLGPVSTQRRSIDFLGAGLISATTTALLLVAEWAGTRYSWGSPEIIGLGLGAVVLGTLFVLRQHRAAEPLFSLTLLRNPVFRIMTPLGFLAGVGLAGAVVYVGGYLQVGRGLTVTQSGLWMLALASGMVLAAPVSRVVLRLFGRYRYLLTLGNFLVASAMLMFATLAPDTPFWFVGAGMFLLGLGLGQSLGIGVDFMQKAVGVAEIGVATTSLRFAQQLGASFGFTLFGSVLNHALAAKHTYIAAVDTVFLLAGIIMVLPVILSLFIREQRHPFRGSGPRPSADDPELAHSVGTTGR